MAASGRHKRSEETERLCPDVPTAGQLYDVYSKMVLWCLVWKPAMDQWAAHTDTTTETPLWTSCVKQLLQWKTVCLFWDSVLSKREKQKVTFKSKHLVENTSDTNSQQRILNAINMGVRVQVLRGLGFRKNTLSTRLTYLYFAYILTTIVCIQLQYPL